MTPTEIATLATSGESETLEFKKTTGTRREATMTICAFLNQGGGQVLFGVTRDGKKSEEITMNSQLSIPKEDLATFCQGRGIKRLAVFGSALREDFGPESDIDVLVEFEPGRVPGLFGLAGMELELSDMFGRDVDLVTRAEVEDSRNYIRRKSILASTEVVYGT